MLTSSARAESEWLVVGSTDSIGRTEADFLSKVQQSVAGVGAVILFPFSGQNACAMSWPASYSEITGMLKRPDVGDGRKVWGNGLGLGTDTVMCP